MTLVDSNVIIDLIGADRNWTEWSLTALSLARATGDTVTSPVVIAELAAYAGDAGAMEATLDEMGLRVVDFGAKAAFRGGKAYLDYRRSGGTRTTILADFLIGGHAAALGAAVLTRDPRRFRTYFPELMLITPENDNG